MFLINCHCFSVIEVSPLKFWENWKQTDGNSAFYDITLCDAIVYSNQERLDKWNIRDTFYVNIAVYALSNSM